MPSTDESTLPGAFNQSTLAPVYVNGMPVTDLVQALQDNQSILTQSKTTQEQRFWSTPERYGNDPTREVFEVQLTTAKAINTIAFDLPRFPHRAYVLYQDTTKTWQPVLDTNKRNLVLSVTDSIPSTIPPFSATSVGHPQHYGAGHWLHFENAIKPLTASKFRVVLLRTDNIYGPKSLAGRALPYSLGLRGFNIGYKIASRDDVPLTNRDPVVVTETESFASSTDILGSAVEFSLRENRASDMLTGAMWKCEPQPITNAVVNLYVDARDSQGMAQVVDRFFIDPTTPGVHVNLYFSDLDPDPGEFVASDDPLYFPKARASGTVLPELDGLHFVDDFGYIDVDNAVTQWDPSRPFWMGLVVQPQFDQTSAEEHVFFDTGAVRFEWNGFFFVLTAGGSSAVRDNLVFTPNQRLGFVLAYDGSTLSIYMQGDDDPNSVAPFSVLNTIAVSDAPALEPTIRLGGLVSQVDSGFGNFRLRSLILKVEAPPGPGDYEAYFADPSGYATKPLYAADDTGSSDNAILRYDPAFMTEGSASVNPYGLVGGAGNNYADIVWTPIQRDFKVQKGFMVFNPVKAKYFKFEFTNLSAQTYDSFEPIASKVQVFPTAAYVKSTPNVGVQSSGNTAGGGATALSDAASSAAVYADQLRLYTNQVTVSYKGTYTPTQALYSPDPTIATRLRSAGSIFYAFQDWMLRRGAPRFVNVQKHIYQTIEVAHTNRTAFFVGIQALTMYRVDYVASDDTGQYIELFQDAANLSEADWAVGDGNAHTPFNLTEPVTMTSNVFASRRHVIGVQFATNQSTPAQVLFDADFNDPSLLLWASVGDAQITSSNDHNTDIGTLVLVQREAVDNFWTTLEARYPSWDAIENSDPDPDLPTWDDLEAADTNTPFGGIKSLQEITPSASGRIYAAARVYSPATLSAPLYLQILDDDGNVLAQEPMDVQGGKITEWYVGYTIGEGGATSTNTWDEMQAIGTWNQVEALGTWDDIDTTVEPFVGRLHVELVQIEPSSDSWYVDNLSVFDDSIVWEFSNDGGASWWPVYDVRNDPDGVFMFPASTAPTAGLQLMWRVTGNLPGQYVDSLVIRPWYDSLITGSPYRETIQFQGPNTAPIDQFPPIDKDPRFRLWHKAIPEDWWFVFRQSIPNGSAPLAPVALPVILPPAIVPVDEGDPPPPLHSFFLFDGLEY